MQQKCQHGEPNSVGMVVSKDPVPIATNNETMLGYDAVIGCYKIRIALEFNSQFDSSAAELLVKFQSDEKV